MSTAATINVTTGGSLQVDGSLVTQPVSGPLTNTQLRASDVSVSVSNQPATATGSAVPANATYEGLEAVTTLPTAASNGNLVGAIADKFGRQAIVLNTSRDLVGSVSGAATGSSASMIAAGGAGTFNDIISLVLTGSGSGGTPVVTITDNGSTGNSYSFYIGGPVVINFPTPLPQGTANAAWNISSTFLGIVNFVVVYAKNK